MIESQDRYDQNRGDFSASVRKYVPPKRKIELTAGIVDPSFVAEIHYAFLFTKLIMKQVDKTSR